MCFGPTARIMTMLSVVLALAATPLLAQTPRSLTLADAVDLARRNNPTFLSVRNDEDASSWQVREAYASLLPSASAGMTYQGEGVQRIGALDFGAASTDYLYSSYGLSVNWTIDGSSIFGITSARAGHDVARASVRAGEFNLEYAVTLQYMTVLRARDAIEVARRQLDRAEQNHDLVRVRAETGAVPMVDAKQAQVERGRAEIALIRAERGYRAEILRLSEHVGVEFGFGVELSTSAEVFEPSWALEDLLVRALSAHPSIEAARARESVGQAQVRQARSGYFPSVSVSTGLRGTTIETLNKDFLVAQAERGLESQRDRCQFENALVGSLSGSYPGFPRSCSQFVLTEADRIELVRSSEVFPLNFTKNPLTVSLTVSLPIFNGFSTQRQVEQAVASAKDARESRRAEELRLRTAVTQAFDAVVTQYRLIALEEGNRQIAEERLTMARQRYAFGAANIIELLDAQASMQAAERDHLNSLYDFQIDLTSLEAASGVRLRPAD